MLFQSILPLKVGEARISHLKLVVVLNPTSQEIFAPRNWCEDWMDVGK